MKRNPQATINTTLAVCLNNKLLSLTIVKARLAIKLVPIVTDVKSDRAAVLALEVSEFVSVKLADFLSISEILLSAEPA